MAGHKITQPFSSKSGEDDWNEACQDVRRLAAQWKEIGRALGLASHQIQEIEGNDTKNSACLDRAIETWIGQNYNTDKFGLPSWRTLCKAVSQVADKKYFKELAEKHKCKIDMVTLCHVPYQRQRNRGRSLEPPPSPHFKNRGGLSPFVLLYYMYYNYY